MRCFFVGQLIEDKHGIVGVVTKKDYKKLKSGTPYNINYEVLWCYPVSGINKEIHTEKELIKNLKAFGL